MIDRDQIIEAGIGEQPHILEKRQPAHQHFLSIRAISDRPQRQLANSFRHDRRRVMLHALRHSASPSVPGAWLSLPLW
jgi:hypothetical protein